MPGAHGRDSARPSSRGADPGGSATVPGARSHGRDSRGRRPAYGTSMLFNTRSTTSSAVTSSASAS